MCRELKTLRQSIAAYANGFDARGLTPSQAGEVVRLCSRMEASIASVKALAAARSAESDGWKNDGFRSASDKLARESGTTASAAKRTLEAGRRMSKQPQVAQAALSGELSAAQAEAVSEGAEANPAKTQELIETAKHGSIQELHEAVAAVKAAATDQEARRRAVHAKRSLRRWTDRDGAMHAHLYGLPEDGAALWRILDPIRRRLCVLRRETNPTTREPFEALDYDALMTIADIAIGKDAELNLTDLFELGLFPQHQNTTNPEPNQPPASQPAPPTLFPSTTPATLASTPDPPPKGRRRRKKLAGSPTRIMIRVDLDTLLRGIPLQGELCELDGYGPIPVSVIKETLANDNPFIIGILTRSKQLIGVYHHGRHPNTHQKSALDFIYPTCAAQGCNSRAALQYDHRTDWKQTHYTLYDLLDRLCPHHHRLKTDHNWALVPGTGKRPFVPPTDPRHPTTNKNEHPPQGPPKV